MTGRALLAAALLLAAPPAGAAAPEEAPAAGTGVLRGVVFDLDTGAPLPGLVVRAGDHPAQRTSRDGAFRLRLPAGDHVVTVRGPGYAEAVTAPLPVVARHETEVLVTVHPDGRAPRLSVEAARPLAAEAPDEAAAGPRGRLRGTLVDAERGAPVADARVYVRGQPVEGRTDAAGVFELELPAGLHDLTVIHPRFASRTETDVEVPPDALGEVRLELTPAGVELGLFTVTAPRVEGSTVAVLDERRQSSAVADILGAEQMAKSGDSDAAGALKRVTGVTVVGGKFVYVRGLGERYSSTLLNDQQLPSPDPERRVVPLDMFPTGMLESVVIQKTWTPDMPGEFGGGVVALRTRGYPGARTVKVGVSTGLLTGTTFQDRLHSTHQGPTDWLGIDGGYRALPDEVEKASKEKPLNESDQFGFGGYPAETLERFGEAMSEHWTMAPRRTLPNLGLSLTAGDGFERGPARFGYLASLLYDNDWSSRTRRRLVLDLDGEELNASKDYTSEEATNTITLGGLLSLGADLGERHRLRLTTLVNRITDEELRQTQGYNDDVQTTLRLAWLRWVERTLVSQQVQGRHVLGARDLDLAWRYAFSVARSLEPDRREYRYDLEPSLDTFFLSDRPDGNRRVTSELRDVAHDLGVDLTVPVALPGERALSWKSGAVVVLKDRTVDTRRFRFLHKGPLSRDDDVLALPVAEIFSPPYIGSDGFILDETTLETDNYTATQQLYAAYTMADVELGHGVRVTGGVRVEHSSQVLSTFVPFNASAQSLGADVTSTDLLPSAAVTWAFRDDMQLRAAVARTVSRPDFREISPATFNAGSGEPQAFGNPDLDRALLTHGDLRWEWYPRPGETLSAGFFVKHFKDPIEAVLVPSAELSQSWDNNESARNLGVELELRKQLDFLHEALADVYVAANGAWIRSSIKLGETIQTSKERALQGQSPYVVNLQLGYDDADRGTSASLLYNVFGRRISEVGALGVPDAYEEPVHQLDLVASQAFGAGFEVGFKARNLLDQDVTYTQGGRVVRRWSRGRDFGLSLSKRF